MDKGVWNLQKLVALFVFLCAISIFGSLKYFSKNLILSKENLKANRLVFLLGNDSNGTNGTDCRNATIDEFPSDFLTEAQRNNGGIIVHVLITLYLFAALAIVCDDYFVKSLEIISNKLNLKQDVAGATFMAAGSSAPELFSSLVGVIIAKSDVGLGTIVGSAVFNVLFILSLCAICAKSSLKLDWYPLTRDCICYSIAVAALIGVLNDGKVHWYEATVLLVMYSLYILLMYFNNSIEKRIKMKVSGVSYYQNEESDLDLKTELEIDDTAPLIRSSSLSQVSSFNSYTEPNETEKLNKKIEDDDDDDDKPLNPFKAPNGSLKKLLWILFLPINIVFFLTIPDCRRKIFSRFPYYFITFFFSTAYLAVLSYVLVWMVVIIAYTIQIPDTVAGLTLLAAGTSIPEVVTGIIVTRQGKGDMAVSNSIGSNIFDILICLGLPWFIQTVFINTNSVVKIYSAGIIYSAVILLSTVVGLILIIGINKFRLSKKLGGLLFLFWIIVTTLTCLFELNVFGNFSLPLCDK